MKIMVFDVPAENGGALTILNQYYRAAVKDEENQWIFVLSTPTFKETENVKIINYPWIKRSWFHRLIFDLFFAQELVKKHGINEVLSLQNVVIPNVKVKQTLYLHQPLPFAEKKYKITENFKFWVYQNLISRIIYQSVKSADKVIVQTKWIKNACLKEINVESDKFELKPPELNIQVKKYYEANNTDKVIFFYPSSGLEYKNHRVIVDAVTKLVKDDCTDFEVVITLDGNENNNIKKLYKRVQFEKLPIKFIGAINLDEVYSYYCKSILIFPSYIETFGLPMLEAKLHGSPIIASDCAFSHEILDDYKKAVFFDPFDAKSLYGIFKFILKCQY